MELLLLSICAAIIAVESQISPLVYSIKQLLYLHQPNKKLILLTKPATYINVIGKYSTLIGLPIIIPIIILLTIHKTLQEMLECSFCLSFHIGWFLMFLCIPQITLFTVITHSLLPLPIVALYQKLRNL
jgi:hypothetical protein